MDDVNGGVVGDERVLADVSDAIVVEAAKQGLSVEKASGLAVVVARDAGGSEDDAFEATTLVAAKMVASRGGSVDDVLVAAVKAVESAGCSGVDVGRELENLAQSKDTEVRVAEGIIGGSKCEGWWW